MPGFYKLGSALNHKLDQLLIVTNQPPLNESIEAMLELGRKSPPKKQTKFAPKEARRKELPATGWLTEKEVSAIIGCSLSLLRQNRHKHKGIPYTKMGRSVRYAAEDVKLFMDRHRVQPE